MVVRVDDRAHRLAGCNSGHFCQHRIGTSIVERAFDQHDVVGHLDGHAVVRTAAQEPDTLGDFAGKWRVRQEERMLEQFIHPRFFDVWQEDVLFNRESCLAIAELICKVCELFERRAGRTSNRDVSGNVDQSRLFLRVNPQARVRIVLGAQILARPLERVSQVRLEFVAKFLETPEFDQPFQARFVAFLAWTVQVEQFDDAAHHRERLRDGHEDIDFAGEFRKFSADRAADHDVETDLSRAVVIEFSGRVHADVVRGCAHIVRVSG